MICAPVASNALEFVHRLLTAPNGEQPDLAGWLAELSAAFAASVAGLATWPEGTPIRVLAASAGTPLPERPLPWREQPDVFDKILHAPTALSVPLTAGGSALLTVAGKADRGGWLLWLEDVGRREWTESEAATLFLVGQVLTRRLIGDGDSPRWVEQLDRAIRKQRMEAAAHLVRRLAHDFGNILTGILGFSELALAQQSASNSTLHTYLSEVHRGAQNGAEYTNQLRLFARRQTSGNRSCNLAVVFSEEEKRLRPTLGADVRFHVELPADLAAPALDADQLRQVLATLLDNAREAISGGGTITLSARTVELSDGEARDLYGDARPGWHVEITVADSGAGLTPGASRQLFAEPFFTNKPRKRGFGLAIAYGIVAAHRGGLELRDRPEGGTLARVVFPTAAVPARSAASVQPAAPRADRILVVDDDPMILHLVTTTLEQAGFRVHAAACAEDALRTFLAAPGGGFHLVLTDILMPGVNGIELSTRLLAHDANVRILFMSGQVQTVFGRPCGAPAPFELLPKPFRPEGLVRAVRTAIDRAANATK